MNTKPQARRQPAPARRPAAAGGASGSHRGPPQGAIGAEARRRPEKWLLRYRIFPSPLGHILIARSEQGIAAVEFLERGKSLRASPLSRKAELEPTRGGDLGDASQDLLDYLHGRRRGFDWPLDLRRVRSWFHRSVLQAATAIPYGAVLSYSELAREVGRPSAARAVAQALRWNPLPIVIPCHRVVGSSGALTGYAGNKLGLKQRLLSLEGVPMIRAKQKGPVAVQTQAMYVKYPGQRAYCLPTCPAVLVCSAAPLLRIASRQSAEEAGLAPCRICRPDLNPLPREPSGRAALGHRRDGGRTPSLRRGESPAVVPQTLRGSPTPCLSEEDVAAGPGFRKGEFSVF